MSTFESELSLVFSHGRAVWGWRRGHRWLSRPLGQALMRLWNHIACRLIGHHWLDEAMSRPSGVMICSYCCRRRRATSAELVESERIAVWLRGEREVRSGTSC